MNTPTNLKLISSGNMPNTTTLQKGEMAFGKIPLEGNIRLFVNDNNAVSELPLPVGANLTGQASAFGQVAANGSATTFARSDHYHALPTPNWSNMPAPPSNNKEYKIRFNGTSWVMYRPFSGAMQMLLPWTDGITTDSTISYEFPNLTAGNYWIGFEKTTSGNVIAWGLYVFPYSSSVFTFPGSF
jgi:hypothetical protein